jgi:transposase
MSESAGYPSDLSDRQRALIEPFLRVWKAKRPSPPRHEGRYELQEIVNTIYHQNRTGCQWAYLPNDLPRWSAVYYYFYFALMA